MQIAVCKVCGASSQTHKMIIRAFWCSGMRYTTELTCMGCYLWAKELLA